MKLDTESGRAMGTNGQPGQRAGSSHKGATREAPTWLRAALLLGVLYVFMSSINMMGGGFKLMGSGLSERLITVTSNPFAALMIGLLTTAVVQSSSLTTSLIVALVSGGQLDLVKAVPIIMGANIGTTITSVLVSMGFVGRRGRFRRAFAGATMHDMFNMLTVAILFPLQVTTGFLSGAAEWFAEMLGGVSGVASPNSPIKVATSFLENGSEEILTGEKWLALGDKAAAAIMIVVALALLFASLLYLTKLMKSFLAGRMESVIDKYLFRTPATALVVGLLITALVQSSSVTTSLLVPLVAAGVVRLEQAFPYTMGANIGTTVTALLAALSAGNVNGLAIALTHTLFNACGTLIFFPSARVRAIPVSMAKGLASLTLRSRWYAVLYVVVIFFVLPLLFLFLWR